VRVLFLALLVGCVPTAPNEWHVMEPFGPVASVTLGRSGITLPVAGGVVLDFDNIGPCGMLHERVHVQQIRRMGQERFAAAYAHQQASRGYRMNCLEIEAYTADRVCMNARGMDWPDGGHPVDRWLSEAERCGCE
jgi:hypothetical protein